ncbi:hypothetical protein KKG65_00865 [Patescibacteria group bacterium]|nr:hypothetical protein [Patescibacteria group bacterium]
MSDVKDGEKTQENERSGDEVLKGELRDEILGNLKGKLEGSDLGTPDEEVMKNFEKILSALPEGKLRQMVKLLEKPARVSGKTISVIEGGKDQLWKRVKLLLAVEVPWVLMIPDDINSKLQAGLIRMVGKVHVGGVKGAVLIAEKIRKIKEKGGSGEEIAETVIKTGEEISNPGEVLGDILS